jgi:mRNA interferase YafQ
MYQVKYPSQFKKDLKLMKRRNLDLELLYKVMDHIEALKAIPKSYHDHPLTSNWKEYRELHIQPDWLLIYKIDHIKKEIIYARTGTHSDLFRA